ncbi:hypothetical protein ABZ917_46700 [Nonomuraea wenchangensis]
MSLSRRSVLAGALALTAAPATAAWASVEPLPDGYVIPGDRAFPTGMAYEARTGHFYVGSAEDGTIYRGHLSRREAEVWLPKEQDGRTVTAGVTVDRDGNLYVAGAGTRTLRVYDTRSGRLLSTLSDAGGGFFNEIAVADDGLAYVTDSSVPVIYRISGGRLERWLDVASSPIDWVDGAAANLNGILATGRHLLTVNSSTGQLWRIDRHTRRVAEVDLGGVLLRNGDGLALRGNLLYVVQGSLNEGVNAQVTVLTMAPGLTRGRYTARYEPPGGFLHPSAIALTDRHALVVNSQYNRWREGLPPVTPFTMSAIPLNSAQPPA